MTQTLTPPLKWHGGKSYLAAKIVELMPPHRHYVEPFAGGLSVMLAKEPEGVSEVANDLNGSLTNFWEVLRSPELFERFYRMVQATPFSQTVWGRAASQLNDEDGVIRACAFFIHCRQSLAGRMKSFAPLSSTRLRRNMNEQVSAWIGCVEGLPAVHRRLRRVAILNRPAIKVIKQLDGPETLFYLDPPYFPTTRAAADVYQHEMSVQDHRDLLSVIKECRGKVMLSGYACEAYDQALSGWRRDDRDCPNHASGGSSKRRMTESLWMNF